LARAVALGFVGRELGDHFGEMFEMARAGVFELATQLAIFYRRAAGREEIERSGGRRRVN